MLECKHLTKSTQVEEKRPTETDGSYYIIMNGTQCMKFEKFSKMQNLKFAMNKEFGWFMDKRIIDKILK